jgi:hypothetical protein
MRFVRQLERVACCPMAIETTRDRPGLPRVSLLFFTEHGEFRWELNLPEDLMAWDFDRVLGEKVSQAVLWFQECQTQT